MKNLFLIALASLTLNAFAAPEKMGADAVEMFQVLSSPQVVECMKSVEKMVNVSVEKTVYRCMGCTTYTISGNKLGIDTPSLEKTVITIKGKAERVFYGYAQTYACEIQE